MKKERGGEVEEGNKGGGDSREYEEMAQGGAARGRRITPSFVYISVHILWTHHEGALRVINDQRFPGGACGRGGEGGREGGEVYSDRCAG